MGWAIAGAGAILGAVGAQKAGKEAKKTAKINAALGAAQADDELNRGAIEERNYRRQLAQFMGRQKTSLAARNVETSGSALRLLEDTAQLGEEEALMIRNNAARTAWGFRNQSNEANRYGRQAASNANVQAASTLLTGGAQAYGLWKAS